MNIKQNTHGVSSPFTREQGAAVFSSPVAPAKPAAMLGLVLACVASFYGGMAIGAFLAGLVL